jgi:hypothetical protein
LRIATTIVEYDDFGRTSGLAIDKNDLICTGRLGVDRKGFTPAGSGESGLGD